MKGDDWFHDDVYRQPEAESSAERESMTSMRPTLYFSRNGTVSERALQAVPVDGRGRVVVARILVPQGILWDDDGWTGKSESVDTITKFRLSEGITWIERKADLR